MNLKEYRRLLTPLLGVCAGWRTFMLDEKFPWSNIHIRLSKFDQSLIELARLHSIRSHDPLDLSLKFTQETGTPTAITRLFDNSVCRWRDIHFHSRAHYSFSLDYIADSLPWQQMTTLKLPPGMPCKTLFDILPQCHNVRELVIRKPTGTIVDRPPIIFPHLTHLTYRVDTNSPSICLYLRTPNMVSLLIDCEGDSPLNYYHDILVFLNASDCNVRTLHVIFPLGFVDSMDSIFKSPRLNSVTEAYLTECCGVETIRALADPTFWPNLEKLRLRFGYVVPEEDDGLMAEVLLARAHVLKVVSIELLGWGPRHEKDFQRLPELKGLGMLVELKFWPG